ncbi:leucine zipper putative tumor suppressor 2-like [Diprion similis]|uniref:leucine zipper putative tumor suppressor 2-like n=1 Tax=Diprion similis TaxID=362088 RepID=UPI001EF9AD28|nr:leucine zipper putative tumor suppressor 2-like [Diprion similis]
MLSQSSWANNRQRYGGYSLRSQRNVHYPPHPAYVRGPRRGPIPGPIRNPINSYRNIPVSSQGIIPKKTAVCSSNSSKTACILPNTPKSSCKKSFSMVDLSPTSIKPDVLDLRSGSAISLQSRLHRKVAETDSISAEVPSVDGGETGSERGMGSWPGDLDVNALSAPPDTNKAAGLVCRALVVNAWRRRREENSQLQETIRQLSQQVEHLHIQIVVLRRLLDAENGRVGRFMAEMQRVRLQFDDITRDRDSLKAEKERAIEEAQKLRDAAEEKSVATENLRNELFTVQAQVLALDGQVSRDREKLLKLREDKKILLDKVANSEALATERLARAETAEAAAEDLRGRLNAQMALLASAHEQHRRAAKEVKVKTSEMATMQKQLQESREAGKRLSLRATNLENELSNRDDALRRLESAYSSQLSELSDLRERLARQSQEGGWSSRVLQIAGSVVRAPRAIFRTLSFLSNPGSSVTS